jgi:hypothetical protein
MQGSGPLVATFIFQLKLFVLFMHLAGLIQAAVRTCCGSGFSAPDVTCVREPNFVGVVATQSALKF